MLSTVDTVLDSDASPVTHYVRFTVPKRSGGGRQLFAPQDTAMKAIRSRFRAQIDSVFTKDQMTRLELRRKETQARREAEQQKEPKKTCSGN